MVKDLFPGHYKPSEQEFQKLWAECIFVLDTNILLNFKNIAENIIQLDEYSVDEEE